MGGANTNVTGVVTAVPDAHGNPKISIDYQANVWDRYNWDEGKGVNVGPLDIPDGEMAKLQLDHCLIVDSSSIHRVQECHVAIYHVLWDLVHTLLADTRGKIHTKETGNEIR